jgi:hypothetical protein
MTHFLFSVFLWEGRMPLGLSPNRIATLAASHSIGMSATPLSSSVRIHRGSEAVRLERIKPVLWALAVTALLGTAIVVGSRNLSRFDAALVAYTFASLFAAFGLTYRYAMWLQRPPTALYWRRGWEAFFKRPYKKQNAINWFKRVITDFGLNRFIWLRGKYRWLAHWLIMWGCVLAAAITFPLVFG